MQSTLIPLGAYYTLIGAVLVLLLGRWLVQRLRWLQDFNIPAPVAGGLVVAAALLALHQSTGVGFSFDAGLRTGFMLAFFASIGLSADFARLRAGGWPLVVFLVVVSVFIVAQNVLGVGLAALLGLDARLGLVAGSITLSGGHGTAAAWGKHLEDAGVQGALVLGMACATFGLVAGGLVGGPVAKRLITRGQLKPRTDAAAAQQQSPFEQPDTVRLITTESGLQTLALFAACLAFSEGMVMLARGTWLELPQFVWALAGGVLLRNALVLVFRADVFDRAIDVFGNMALSLFLAMALMALNLWELAGLAAPVLIVLLAQTVLMVVFATWVTFRFMGADYDAAILAAGHCGFGMGATPTAVANMQALTDRFGPSHKAFLIVPMVGAFFIDLVNAAAIKGFLALIAQWA